jgi:light-independent protochlorophyllide reductase subunit N
VRTLFLVGSCPSEVIKLDLARAAQRLDARHRPDVRVLSYSGSGIETTFTEGEDACLAAMVPECPAEAPDAPASLLVVGTVADVVEDQLGRLFDAMGVGPVRFFPPRRARSLPPVGPNTRVLLAQPFVNNTLRALERRGARRLDAVYPFGAEGTRRWLRAAADAFGVDDARFDAAVAPALARARRAVAQHRAAFAGRRVFFFPDSQLELPLARFLHEELGAELVEVGTPYLDRTTAGRRAGAAPRGRDAQRGAGRGAAARPLPPGAPRPRGLRPRPRQPARGRGDRDQVVDRAGVLAGARVRPGRRPRRLFTRPLDRRARLAV